MFQFGDILGNSCSHTCQQPVVCPWVHPCQERTWVLKMSSGAEQQLCWKTHFCPGHPALGETAQGEVLLFPFITPHHRRGFLFIQNCRDRENQINTRFLRKLSYLITHGPLWQSCFHQLSWNGGLSQGIAPVTWQVPYSIPYTFQTLTAGHGFLTGLTACFPQQSLRPLDPEFNPHAAKESQLDLVPSRRDPEQRKPWTFIPYSLCVWKSAIFLLSPQLLQCLSVWSPGWCPLQLHPELPALTMFLNSLQIEILNPIFSGRFLCCICVPGSSLTHTGECQTNMQMLGPWLCKPAFGRSLSCNISFGHPAVTSQETKSHSGEFQWHRNTHTFSEMV